ncbi:MAG: hypothetical protein FVQ82_13170 [Planctomycetes bacterium]|nr:hypothetical protein [Planctomycetota bacterium]
MAIELKVPIPDQTTEEVRIVEWKKNVGDAVKHGDIILEIETDKAVMEVESTGEGTLIKQLVIVDDMVPVGQVIGFIGEAGEVVDTAAQAPPSAKSAPAPTASVSPIAAPAAVQLDENVTEVKVPIPDQTTEEVRIVGWKKAVGDAVNHGDVILEIETDKAVMEVESAGEGILLQQLVAVDDMIPVGQVIGFIGPEGTAVQAAPAAQAKPAAPPVTQAAPSDVTEAPASPLARKIAAKTGVNLDSIQGSGAHGKIMRKDVEAGPASASLSVYGGRLFASPNAKRLAKDMDVDLMDVIGTGPNGRIIGTDVESYGAQMPASSVHGGRLFASPNAKRLAGELAVDLLAITGTGPNNRIIGADVIAYAEANPVGAVAAAPGQPVPGTEVELTKMRRAIGINLQNSFRDTPHFNVTMSFDMTKAMKVRSQLNKGKEKPEKVSVNDLVVRACTVALKKYPAVNSKFLQDRIRYEADINVGVATAVEAGLIVPVVLNADTLGWKELAAATKNVVGQARGGKLIGLGKGTFTVSNLGMFGVDNFTAIINPPEAAILAVGGLKETVVAINGMISVKPMMTVTLCSDHRVVDGALAAQFLGAIKLYLEEEIS